MKRTMVITLAAAVSFGASLSQAELVNFYVGQDALATLASGTYQGLPNPNAGRLTFLYAHDYLETPFNNHYHGIGTYTYSGPADAPVLVPTNANFRIPEASTGQLPLTLVVETNGLHAGKLVNKTTAEHYSDPRVRSVHRMLEHATGTGETAVTNTFGWGSAEYIMFHSGARRWTNDLAGVVVALELVEKSPELHVGSTTQLDALVNPADRLVLGEGNTFDFTPVVWAEANTAPGIYSLRFKLVDASGRAEPMAESGIVTFWYRVVGEPQLAIARTVTLSLPMITDGYVLEEAPSVDGPWTAVAAAPTVETLTGGHSAAQTGNKVLTQPTTEGMKYYRLRKL